jgi:hypothetical protein
VRHPPFLMREPALLLAADFDAFKLRVSKLRPGKRRVRPISFKFEWCDSELLGGE